jgi:hypothetical protein
MYATVQRMQFPPSRRILCISDVHGNLPYLKGLLRQVNFSQSDILIFLGDFLEKGPESLNTLRFIMNLRRTHTVYGVCGNCDGWHIPIDRENGAMDEGVKNYMLTGLRAGRAGLLAQMCIEAGIPLHSDLNLARIKGILRERFAPELQFLRELPTIIDTPHYTFVHGGLPRTDLPLELLEARACMKNDNFMNQGLRFDKWVIVGHWPVVLYGKDITCANPIIDGDSHIISIDGGCVLKDDGQLNALIIPEAGSEVFAYAAYDPFPTARVLEDQEGSSRSAYFRWGDNIVSVLRSGPEFSLCRHVRTGYEMEILSKYLYHDGDLLRCNDCTDYVLPLQRGDLVSVVESSSRGYLVKHQGISGWYRGSLDFTNGSNANGQI